MRYESIIQTITTMCGPTPTQTQMKITLAKTDRA